MRGWKKCASVMLMLSGTALARPPCPADQTAWVSIGDQRFAVEVATDDASRSRGLSGRERLPPGNGMWFVLPDIGRPGFWMRGMRFPIDLIWVSPDGKVAGSTTLPVCRNDPCPITYPPMAVAHVLEIEAGRFRGRTGEAVTWACDGRAAPGP